MVKGIAAAHKLGKFFKEVKESLLPEHIEEKLAAGEPAFLALYGPCPCGSGKKFMWCCKKEA